LPGKHGPNRLANYLEVHEAWMRALLDEGFVVEDRCDFIFLPSVILLQGTITCLDDLTIEVEKEIAVLGGRGMTAEVRTRKFRYHAWIRGVHNVFRYDSVHGHRPYPHKHVYDTFGTGLELEVVQLADEDSVPTLGEVLRELQTWYTENVGRIAGLA
jgi:hypothetical protein